MRAQEFALLGDPGKKAFQTADGHPCVIIYSRSDSAVLAREEGHHSVPSQAHTPGHVLNNTHTHKG